MQGIYRFRLYPLTGGRVCGQGLQVLLHSHTHMFGRIGALLSIDQCTDKNIFSVDPYFKAAILFGRLLTCTQLWVSIMSC